MSNYVRWKQTLKKKSYFDSPWILEALNYSTLVKTVSTDIQQHLSDSQHLHDLKTAESKCLWSVLRG